MQIHLQGEKLNPLGTGGGVLGGKGLQKVRLGEMRGCSLLEADGGPLRVHTDVNTEVVQSISFNFWLRPWHVDVPGPGTEPEPWQ